jgi:3-hydroxyisobutyrate dehydrogenase-like beta-hydroxyacid dehydrogenase
VTRPDSPSEADAAATVGILHAGDMGAALGVVLVGDGHRVITVLDGRGAATRRRAEEAGLVAVPALRDVVREADVVVSLVPPAAAEALAEDYLGLAGERRPGQVFADANSISPELAVDLAARLAGAGVPFADVAIHGQARQLREAASFFVSGDGADRVVEVLGRRLFVEHVGPWAGRASAMKMLTGGLAKGMVALFLELGAVASRLDLLAPMMAAYGRHYPEFVDAMERMVPTYPRHAARRVDEMRFLEGTMRAAGIEPRVIAGVREAIAAVADAPVGDADAPPGGWSAHGVVAALEAARERARAAPPAPADAEATGR